MKNLYMEVPLLSFRYPSEVYDLAKRAGVKPQEIAERDKIEVIPVINYTQWRFDIVVRILMITGDEEVYNKSFIDFDDGSFEIVQMNHRKLAQKITKYCNDNEIKFAFQHTPAKFQEYEDSEERAEMEGDEE